jgi:hypothetical protein
MASEGNGGYAERFLEYMAAVRQVAGELAVPLIDHLLRWERLRRRDLEAYRKLMADNLHMSALGHAVFGLDVLRTLGADYSTRPDLLPFASDGLAVQHRLDKLIDSSK